MRYFLRLCRTPAGPDGFCLHDGHTGRVVDCYTREAIAIAARDRLERAEHARLAVALGATRADLDR